METLEKEMASRTTGSDNCSPNSRQVRPNERPEESETFNAIRKEPLCEP